MRTKLTLLLLFLASTVVADEARMRELLATLDADAAVAEYESSPGPHSIVERALYVTALERISANGRADEEAARLKAEHPEDAWAWFADAYALDSFLLARAPTEKMMALAGDHPDPEMVRMRARALAGTDKAAEVSALLDAQPRTPYNLMTRVIVHSDRSSEIDPAVYAMLDDVLKLDPDNLEALYWKGLLLRFEKRSAEALPLLAKAAARTKAPRVLREYWAALRAQNREAVAPAIEAAITGSPTPGLLFFAANEYYELGDKERTAALEQRILRDAPATFAAQAVLNQRYLRARGDAAATLKAAREFVAWPTHYDPYYRANAYRTLFRALRDDPDASPEELLVAVHGLQNEYGRRDYDEIATTLADRKLELAEAEKFARAAFAETEKTIEELRGEVPKFEEFAASQRGSAHNVLGWVLLQRGKNAEAEKELLAAYELSPKSPQVLYHLGRLYESKKKLAKAESLYRRGYLIQIPMKNPNEDALKELYRKRFGTLDGFEASLKQAKSFEAESRRKEILRGRLTKDVPQFTMKTLDGNEMKANDLKGRITVVNFWGIWCSWCVRELPDFQKLVGKYASDPKVSFLTVNNDDDAEKVRRWMAEHKYAFPVLLDNGFGHRVVSGYPTTWFIDPKGKIRFEQNGWSQELVEEFSWRIEALR